jgi:DNA-binding NtrC family response regulator
MAKSKTPLPRLSLAEIERQRIEECLADHDGNKTHAANELGVSVRTLRRKLKAWNAATSPRGGLFVRGRILLSALVVR